MTQNLDLIVIDAQAGDKTALESLVRGIQDRIHHLAMRMLVNPSDASEATQEILILIVTKLSTFKGESAFSTWAYRVASNYLLSARKIIARDPGLSFEVFAADLENGLTTDSEKAADELVLLNELRISCTMAMLLCLNLDHRMAYVLGDILELDHSEAAEIVGISKGNFRKRLSRARADVVAFTAQKCGLANNKAKCSCPRRLSAAVTKGRVSEKNIIYATNGAPEFTQVLESVKLLEGQLKTLKLQMATPHFRSPKDFGKHISDLIH